MSSFRAQCLVLLLLCGPIYDAQAEDTFPGVLETYPTFGEWSLRSPLKVGETVRGRVEEIRQASKRVANECLVGECSLQVVIVGDSSEYASVFSCKRYKVGELLGSPVDCEFSFGVDDDGVWDLIKSSTLGFRGVEGFRIEIESDRAVGEFVTAAKEALAGDALSLQVLEEGGSLVGVSDRRRSRILADWWEYPTVRVFSARRRGHIEVSVSIVLYVNQFATSGFRDWHMPSEEQRQRYRAEVEAELLSSFRAKCAPTQVRRGSIVHRLTCP